MFKSNQISVALGDVFHEPLNGSGKLLRQLNIGSAPGGPMITVWNVVDLLSFNNLPHARLHCAATGETRLISISVLSEQRGYIKVAPNLADTPLDTSPDKPIG